MKISLADENENEINFTIVAIKRKINGVLRCSKTYLQLRLCLAEESRGKNARRGGSSVMIYALFITAVRGPLSTVRCPLNFVRCRGQCVCVPVFWIFFFSSSLDTLYCE